MDGKRGERRGRAECAITHGPALDINDLLANAHNKRGDWNKGGDKSNKQAGGKEEMDVASSRA